MPILTTLPCLKNKNFVTVGKPYSRPFFWAQSHISSSIQSGAMNCWSSTGQNMFLQKRRKKIAFCDHHLIDFKSYFFAFVDSCVIICVITIIFIITITIIIIILIIIIIIIIIIIKSNQIKSIYFSTLITQVQKNEHSDQWGGALLSLNIHRKHRIKST